MSCYLNHLLCAVCFISSEELNGLPSCSLFASFSHQCFIAHQGFQKVYLMLPVPKLKIIQFPCPLLIDYLSSSETVLQGFCWTQFLLFSQQCWTSGLRLNTRDNFKLLTFVHFPTIISLMLLPIFLILWDSVQTFFLQGNIPWFSPTRILPHQQQLPGGRQVTFFYWFLLFC